MKLVELLSIHLQSWGAGVVAYAQDMSGDVYGYASEPIYGATSWQGGACANTHLGVFDLCDDQSAAFATRGDWLYIVECAHAEQIIPEPAFDAVAAGLRVRQIVDDMAEMRDERDRLCAELDAHGLAVPGIEYRRPIKTLRDAYPGLVVEWAHDASLRSVVAQIDKTEIRVIHSDGSEDWCKPEQLIALPA